MEEDLEILEKLASQKYDDKLLNTLNMINEQDEVYILTIFERQAIEHLISAYKELEEENKRKDETIKNLHNALYRTGKYTRI